MNALDLPPVDAARLLALLRERLGSEAVTFAEAPGRLASGGEAVVDAFHLTGPPSLDVPWRAPLVLRRLLPLKDPSQLRWEAAVHDALHAQGFPVPRVLWVEPDPSRLGSPFLVAERVMGEVMLQAVTRTRELARHPQRLPNLVVDALFRVPGILAETQARLHRLDPGALRQRLAVDRLDAAEVSFEARLGVVSRRIREARLEGLVPGLAWLERERPAPEEAVICHGDLVFTNLCVARGRVSGVFDWSAVTLAEPAYDVAATLARLWSHVPGLPPPLAWLTRRVQAGLARRYLAAYRRALPVDPRRLHYYEAYWILSELAWSGTRLRVGASGDDAIEHRWLHRETIEVGVAAFRRRTGLTLAPLLPPAA